jgi:hypothetical protein
MKVQLGHIVQNLFHADSLDDVPVSRLQEMAETHPYFGAGHLLLSQKLKHQQSSGFETQIQKTALYFHDPLWLHWQLEQHEKETVVIPLAVPEEVPEPVVVEEDESVEVTEDTYEPDSIEPPPQPNPEADPEPPVELPSPDTEQPAPVIEPIKADPDSHRDKPEFEPYHTVDYFASQGIKISNEVQPGDRLGKQLKSFTEWLKTMKRLPQTTPGQVEENGDQDIRRIAAGSLVEKQVVTETMAEVLLKQDKRDEAIGIYEKLSLLDPSKRAYFAAKIENLKEN